MILEHVKEGDVELFVPRVGKTRAERSSAGPRKNNAFPLVTAKSPAFFNPVQVTNRDISVLLASCLLEKNAAVLDLLSATGARAVRFAKEVGLKNVFANDANPTAVKLIKKNTSHNKVNLKIFNLRAHEFLACKYKLNPKIYFDYIDIDPFGTPVPFLDAAVKSLVPNGGIIAVTATDTANLCGVNVNACRRIYGAVPSHGELMHEIGIRILLKKIIEVGAQYDLALTPIFCHSTLHYMRVYLRAETGAKKADEILKNVGMHDGAGPMWLGQLWDEKLVDRMFAAKDNLNSPRWASSRDGKSGLKSGVLNPRFFHKFKLAVETKKLLFTILAESKISVFGFYDLATIKFKQTPKINDVISRLHAAGFAAARTHFSESGVRTNADEKALQKILVNSK